MHQENLCKAKVLFLKDYLIHYFVNKLRSISAPVQQTQSRSRLAFDPTNDQLYNFAVDVIRKSNKHSIIKSKYELFAESVLDNISEIDGFRQLLSEMTKRDTYLIDNPFIKHDFFCLIEGRYYFPHL